MQQWRCTNTCTFNFYSNYCSQNWHTSQHCNIKTKSIQLLNDGLLPPLHSEAKMACCCRTACTAPSITRGLAPASMYITASTGLGMGEGSEGREGKSNHRNHRTAEKNYQLQVFRCFSFKLSNIRPTGYRSHTHIHNPVRTKRLRWNTKTESMQWFSCH